MASRLHGKIFTTFLCPYIGYVQAFLRLRPHRLLLATHASDVRVAGNLSKRQILIMRVGDGTRESAESPGAAAAASHAPL